MHYDPKKKLICINYDSKEIMPINMSHPFFLIQEPIFFVTPDLSYFYVIYMGLNF
jgi:hypothetical protein